MPCRRRLRLPLLAPALALAALALAPAARAITGVCPDGSIFVVRSAEDIPCRDARRVDSNDVPPLQPEYLPRPYGWEVFNREADPNNPYNVVRPRGDAPPEVGPPPPPSPRTAPGSPPPPVPSTTPAGPPRSAPPQVAAAPPPSAAPGLDLALSEREIGDLGEIVALMQSVAPATVTDLGDGGERRLAVQLARSQAFEQRVHGALARRGGARGPVVLFRAEAGAPVSFHGNLTFVQGHVAFHPDPEDPSQFGVLDGRPGTLAPGDAVLGYAVLPPHVDPARPLDIYWNDRRITATLRP